MRSAIAAQRLSNINQALRAAEELLSSADLQGDVRDAIIEVIKNQRGEGKRKYIKPANRDRWTPSERILKNVQQ
jgi:hypothetical protein